MAKAPFVLDFRHQAVLGIQNLELQTDLLTQRTILSRGYTAWGLESQVLHGASLEYLQKQIVQSGISWNGPSVMMVLYKFGRKGRGQSGILTCKKQTTIYPACIPRDKAHCVHWNLPWDAKKISSVSSRWRSCHTICPMPSALASRKLTSWHEWNLHCIGQVSWLRLLIFSRCTVMNIILFHN